MPGSLPPTTYTVRQFADRWFLVIDEGGREMRYPAASKIEAEVMMGLEKNKRAGKHPR